MQWSKIKTVIIILLAVVNLSLGVSFAYTLYSRDRVSGSDREVLSAYLESIGITLADNALPIREKTLDALEFLRESVFEANIASRLLGETDESNLGGGIAVYTSEAGEAMFRRSGMFEITLNAGVSLPKSSSAAEKTARGLLKKAGISIPKGGASVESDTASFTVTFTYIADSVAVKNAGLTVTFSGNTAVIRGVLLAGGSDALKCDSSTLIGLVSVFAEICENEGLGVTAIERAYYCYWYTKDENGNGLLLPALAIVTPQGEFVFNTADKTLVG